MPIGKTAICAALLIAAGAALRLWGLGDTHPGIFVDEASSLYDAWALLHFGIDRNGHSWPVHFVAYGGGEQHILQPYLALPFIWAAGLDEVAFRLPVAISGAASLLLIWKIARNADSGRFALIALLFLALSTWHIMSVRWAVDTNMLPFVVLLSVYFLSRRDRNRFGVQAAAAATIALSVYAYATAWPFAPMFLAAAFAWLALNGVLTRRRFFALSAVALAVAAPMIAFLIVNRFDLDTIRILGATIPRYPGPARYEALALPFAGNWERIPSNIVNMSRLLMGYYDGNLAHALPGWGALPRFFIIAAIGGLGVALHRAIVRKDFGVHLLVALWFVLALAVAAVVEVNIRRMNLVWMPALYLAALGLSALRIPRAALCAAVAAFIALGGVFAYQYFRGYAALAADYYFPAGLKAAIDRAAASAGENETIYVSSRINQPYLHALVRTGAFPHRYLETRVVENPGAGFERVIAFGRFVFVSPFTDPDDFFYWEPDYEYLRIAGIDINAINHYILSVPQEAADDADDADEAAVANMLAADGFIVERHGAFAYAYRQDGAPGGAGAMRPDAPLVQGEPAARAEFDLHIQDGELVYYKQPCIPQDTRHGFFLHVFPESADSLPEARRRHGFDNLDFRFMHRGALYGHRCMARVALPDYAIAAIETGQIKPAWDGWNKLWTAELKF